jgi:T1SS-143 domain-containing protein
MRYEDTSNSVSNSATPEARNDADALPTGSNGPATGNVITGTGTLTGLAGADGAPNGHVVEIRGAGGTDTAEKGHSSMHVDGRFGALVIDEHGNYKYVADGHAPEDFRDLFQYTLVDAKGGRSTADLMITRGAELKVADNAQRVVPGPDGVVTLPAGVDLNDVHVLGRDLIVTLPDGSQIVIVDGAVFVPQLVLGGVEVPSTNLASLLVQSELNTGAGPTQSSGGNFDVPVPPLDPGVPLGDLIPPTELVFTPPEIKEIGQFIDKHPDAGTVSVQLDDDDVPGKNGNPGGTGDDAGAPNATTSGNLPGSGGDGALTWDLSDGGAPAGFTYVDGPNGSILVQQVQGGNPVTVLTITIDAATGAYTVTENAPILHAAGDNENNASFTILYTVTDADGDTAVGSLNINVDDDTPTVSVTAGSDAEVSLTTHDAATVGANSEAVSTSANFGGVFSGSTSSPGADGAGAGTTDGYALSTTGGASGLFSHGVAINLYNVGGVIVGSTATTAAGIDAGNTVFSVSTDNTGVVTLTQFSQIDHTADPSPTGAPFTDDIMSLTDGSITLTRSVTVVDKDGDSVTGSAAVGIGANLHFVDDGPTIGLADHGEPNLVVDETNLALNDTQSFAASFSASFGADGPAANSITYALGISAAGADSGLVDTATGQAIVLVQNGAVVEGHVGNAAGALAFTVSVNAAGDVTLDQIRAVVHPDATNPDTDESVTLSADNLVTLTATAHDFDGDTASSTINIGTNLVFHDDGPSAINDSDTITSGGTTATGNVITGIGTDAGVASADNVGADLPGQISAIQGAGGTDTTFSGGLLSIGGTYGTLAIDADGNYTYTRSDGSPLTGQDVFTYTLTDADGDSVTATLTINIADAAPIGGSVSVLLDDDALAGGNPGGTGDDVDAQNVSGTLPGSGGDGALTFDLLLTGAPAGFTYIDGPSGSVLVQQGGITVLTITINASTGAYTVVQNAPIDHAAGGNENNQAFTINYTVTDSDGDAAPGTVNINVDDDTPIATATLLTGTVDEDGVPGGIAGGPGDVAGEATTATGSVAALFSAGADAPLTFSLLANTSGLPALTSGGVAITYSVVGNTLTASAGGNTVFTFTVNPTTGAYTFTLVDQIDHPTLNGLAGDNTENDLSISLGSIIQATDHDGDSVTANANGLVITVDDDTPVAVNDADAITSGGTSATGNVITGVGTTGGVSTADSPGADAPATITAIAGTGGTDTTFSGGVLSIGGSFGTLSIDAAGNYTYTRNAGSPGNAQDVFTYTLTDADGDSVTATLTINIADAAPIGGSVTVGLDDDALAGGNPGGIGDDPNSVNATGTLPGSGGDGALTFGVALTGAPAGFSYVSGGAGIVLVQQGGVTVLTVTVNSTTGAYSVVENAPINHAAGGDENNQAFTINYTVTDADGDSAPGTINISVDDDTPTVSANLAVQLDDDALAGGNAGGTGDDPNATNTSGTLAHSYGADGAGSVAYLTTGAPSGFSYVLQGTGDLWVMQGAVHVLTLTVNATTGAYSVSQVAPIDHPAGLDENNVSFTISYNVTDHDGDSATGTIVVNVDDDTPTAAIVTTGQHISVDESVGNQGDSNDVTGPIAAFTGVTNVGDDPDVAGSVIQYATNASAIVASTGSSYGADGAGTTVFSLNVSSAGVDSGLNTTDGHDILLTLENGIVVGRVSGGADDGKAAFAISIDSTGHISMVEYLSIQQPDATNADDMVSIANGAILAVVTVTDHDGDTATQSTGIGSLIQFQDSGPVMTGASNINIQNSGDVANTGAFAFNLGADGAPASNDVISIGASSATVNGTAVTNWTLTAGAETATTASYTFSFDYPNGAGTTAHETGTLTFDKASGTYTVDLANPIAGFSLLDTAGADASAFVNYNADGTTSQGPSNIATVALANDLFLQFTGVHDSSGSPMSTTVPAGGTFVAQSGVAFSGLDLFSDTATTVTVSSTAAGVAGNTIQGGEVLDFNLYATDPLGTTGGTPTANATSMFIELDGVGGSEDMIVVLKLYDTLAHTYSEVALMVQNGDIITSNATLAGTAYAGIVLDNNDGLIVIEANDYQNGNTNLVIVGAQIAGSDAGITGTAENFNGTLGGSGGWLGGTQSFDTDVSDQPFKIQNIGFLRTTTTDQTAHLSFDVTIKDGDGDTVTQTITADVTAAVDSSTPISLSAAVTTVAPVVLDLNGDGVHFLSSDAGVHYDYGSGSVATAWASPQDGILVNDANHNGTVDNASEFVFGSGSVTDLQALAGFDSNGDGQLSSADANFANFAVWQDANSNGVVDAGEMQSLTAQGIASISLSTDAISYTAAGGDVTVAGTGTYTNADGSTGSLADAAFVTGTRTVEQDLRTSSALSTNTALIGALAAAGLAASDALAAASDHAGFSVGGNHGLDTAALHTQAFAPVAVDALNGDHASNDLLPAASGGAAPALAQSAASHASEAGAAHGLSVGNDTPSSHAPTELLDGTQSAAHNVAPAVAAASIVMPAAAQLAALANASVGGAQHNQVVGQVLADALHGGGGEATIDSALASLPGHGGANAALEALASHAGAAVSNGDTGVFAAFTAVHSAFNMEAMAVHADAIQAHA